MNLNLSRLRFPFAFAALLLGLGAVTVLTSPADRDEANALDLREAGRETGGALLLQRAEPRARPVRASLAMPYFSFAQSLRPRG